MVPTEINTGNYDNFTAGVGTVDKLNKALETRKTEFEGYKNSLNNESVFAGPMCDSAVEAFTNLATAVDSTVTNFSKIGEYINQVLSNYQDADSDALAYLNIKDDGTLATSTTAPSGDQDLVNALNKQIGKRINDFGDSDHQFNDEAWCADFVCYMLRKEGYNVKWSSVAGAEDSSAIFGVLRDQGAKVHYEEYSKALGKTPDTDYTPQAGDVFLINVDDDKGVDHVGFVVKDNGDGTITTIEGNTFDKVKEDYDGGVVQTHVRNKSDVYGYATPVKN